MVLLQSFVLGGFALLSAPEVWCGGGAAEFKGNHY